MTLAVETHQNARFFSQGRAYLWSEGDEALHPRAARGVGRRDALRAAFFTVVLPDLDRRHAERVVRGSGPRGGAARAHWVVWTLPRENRTVWALFVPTRPLGARAVEDLGRPANDGALLAAWGDGPVMAWVSDRPEVRDVVREALRALPPFLSAGFQSGDVTMPVRIVPA